ncbi:hypothetical protein CC86DRAFT_450427 [Ophiobolus disseminans]|uniref:Uncharacterized protein n=1 Tax=Ophiobolus disseminans TaxID=1469910 RepID=A0A6A6ZEA8_9PLEO|nr:hypothetical protein CC86DRAFT_450427 [Ophiobolus disseminans]
MFARLATRAPVATRAFARYHSSSSASGAARVIQMAAQAERPSAAEAAVPVMWAVCGALTYTAWNRMDATNAGGNVEKLIII